MSSIFHREPHIHFEHKNNRNDLFTTIIMTDKYEDPCALNPPSKIAQPFSSWSEAFGVAKNVEPQDLGSFMPPNESSSGNVALLSEIARQYHATKRKADSDQGQNKCGESHKVKKRKKEKKVKKDKKRSSSDKQKEKDGGQITRGDEIFDPITDDQEPLEGQIVMHNGEQVMVLVDYKKKIVYSMDRAPNGQLLPIGKVQEKQIILNGKSLFHFILSAEKKYACIEADALVC
jgi:hypothetical protein